MTYMSFIRPSSMPSWIWEALLPIRFSLPLFCSTTCSVTICVTFVFWNKPSFKYFVISSFPYLFCAWQKLCEIDKIEFPIQCSVSDWILEKFVSKWVRFFWDIWLLVRCVSWLDCTWNLDWLVSVLSFSPRFFNQSIRCWLLIGQLI